MPLRCQAKPKSPFVRGFLEVVENRVGWVILMWVSYGGVPRYYYQIPNS